MAVRPRQPVILALPRGGVPVAHEIAVRLGAPLNVLAVRKLGAPQNPEFGLGAVAEDGTVVINREALAALGVGREDLERIIAREVSELRRRVARYRRGRPLAGPRRPHRDRGRRRGRHRGHRCGRAAGGAQAGPTGADPRRAGVRARAAEPAHGG